ncbi:5804_t:CDS:2 [Acaulospora morrowiae]|uniref:5804_t:CDS:1 n=1 Tax=Acaulospora morrowiae TaxID=94023 RepID=A0A9N9CB05_9GLOM|nr:5804_t:CDS:2 [Acaulospora morrowiae]
MIPSHEVAENESIRSINSEVNTPLLVEESRNEPQIDFSRYGRFAIFRRSKAAVICVTAVTLFLDMIVYGIVVPILPLLVHERLGMDAKAIGFLFGCYAIGLLGATPIFAILSDRHHTRKIPMLFGMASLGTCTLLFGVSTAYWQLVLARIAQGASGGASWTISLAMLADRFGSGRKLGLVMGTVLSANTLGFITGPLVGGILYKYWGPTAPFVFCAALSFIGFLVVCTIVEPIHLKEWDRAISIRSGEPLEDMESESGHLSMLSLMKEYNIVTICLTVIVAASVFSGIEPTLPIHLHEKFNADASQIGLVYVSVVVPTFISPLVGYLSYTIGQRNMVGIGMTLTAAASPLIALPNKLWIEAIPLLFFGATYSIAITPTLPLLGQEVAKNGGGAYGQVYALWNMAYSIGMFVGPVVAGLMLEYYRFLGAMLAFSLISLCIVPLSFLPSSWLDRCTGSRYSRIPSDDPIEEEI